MDLSRCYVVPNLAGLRGVEDGVEYPDETIFDFDEGDVITAKPLPSWPFWVVASGIVYYIYAKSQGGLK